MNPVPADVIRAVAATRGSDRSPVQDLGLTARDSKIIVQRRAAESAAGHDRLLEAVPGIVCDEVWFDREDVDVREVCVRGLALKFFDQGVELEIEELSGAVVIRYAADLVELRWVGTEFQDVLR